MQRYEEFGNILKQPNGKRRYASLRYVKIPQKSSDLYIMGRRSDRMDNLAAQYYGDPRYWVILAKANNLNTGSLMVPINRRLRIPYPMSREEIERYFTDNQF